MPTTQENKHELDNPPNESNVEANEMEQGARRQPWAGRVVKWTRTALHHLQKHMGVGVVCAVAYFDPGNWSVDLQAGSEFGYDLLFVVLIAGVMAVVFQAMASRLGCVTGLDLATHCRLLLYNRSQRPKLVRYLVLYPLYGLAELAIISTDLAELLGSATALVLLFPRLPLWAGVLLTATDVLFILALGDPTRGRPVRLFELLIAVLVAAVFASLIVVIAKVEPNIGEAFEGFAPNKALFAPGGLYTSVGIIGATVMPHGLFLGSSLATQDRISSPASKEVPPTIVPSASLPQPTTASSPSLTRRLTNFWRTISLAFRATFSVSRLRYDPRNSDFPDCEKGHRSWVNNPLSFVRAHLWHGVVDVVASLLGFAVAINALILVLAAAVFYYGTSGASLTSAASLFEAHDIIKTVVGKPAAVLFALGLLCAGQSASITATLAGQVVSEGFLRWRISPIFRRLITRLIGLVPSMLVAVIVGRRGVASLLVASQVALSIVLPFVAFPLVYLTSSKQVMRVRRPRLVTDDDGRTATEEVCSGGAEPWGGKRAHSTMGHEGEVEAEATCEEEDEWIDYSNGKVVMCVGYVIWAVVLVANGYVLVTLALGEGS